MKNRSDAGLDNAYEDAYIEFLQTPYGVFAGVERVIRYESGEISDIFLGERNVIMTHAGDLVPFYLEETPRRKYKSSVAFYPGGMIKSVYLEEQQEVQTPVGLLPAEFVTFYEMGELKRVFILDGKLSGFWSEEDERGLNIPLSFEFPFGSFTAMLVGLCFYKSGAIRSVTLYPGEQIELEVSGCGKVPVRTGFSLFEDGGLESLEPAEAITVPTPAGYINAYNSNATGVNADACSLVLDSKGRVVSAVTSSDKLLVTGPDKPLSIFAPSLSACPAAGECDAPDDDYYDPYGAEEDDIPEPALIPLRLDFDYEAGTVKITGETAGTFSLSTGRFQVMHGDGAASRCSPEMCKSCMGCPSKI